MSLLFILAGVLLLLFLFWCLALAGQRAPGRVAPLRRFRYAHRGLHDAALGIPENSLTAFHRAVASGFGAELDIHLSRDGRLVVMHDSSLQRMTGFSGTVEELDADQLSSLRLAATDEPVPFLEQVLPIFAGKTPLILELKTWQNNGIALVQAVCRMLDAHPQVRFCIESFDPRPIRWLRQNRPEIVRGILAENFLRRPGQLSLPMAFWGTNLLSNFLIRPNFVAYRFTDRDTVSMRLCRKLWRLQEVSWTLQSPQELAQAESNGAIAIFEGFLPQQAASPLCSPSAIPK